MSTQLSASRLNLGCGEDTRENMHNVDIEPLQGVDEVVDLDEFPWPWPSETFTIVHAHHVLEHLREPMQALREIVRVCQANGGVVITYPIGHTRFEDPTHRNFWNYCTAEAIAGERKHGHEGVKKLELKSLHVNWHVGSAPERWYTRARLWFGGPGPWLSGVPGLSGEVRARFRRRP